MPTEVYLPEATEIRVPADLARSQASAGPRQAPSIRGNRFAVVRNSWRAMAALSDAVEDRLLELGAGGVEKILVPEGAYAEGSTQQLAPTVLDEIAGRVTGAVFGLGN